MYFIFPYFTGICAIFIFLKLGITYKIKGFPEVLSSMIGFASSIIGFYSAMYGIIVSLPNSKLLARWKKKDIFTSFKYQVLASLFWAIVIFLLSIFMQICINYSYWWIQWLFLVWIFLSAVLISITMQTIVIFLVLLFDTDEQPSTKGLYD